MGAMSTVIKLNELKRKNILRINFNDHKHYFVLNTDRADFCLNGQKIIAQSYDFLWTNDYRKIFPQKEKWNRTHRITKYSSKRLLKKPSKKRQHVWNVVRKSFARWSSLQMGTVKMKD